MIEKIQFMHKDFRESFDGMPYESIGRVLMALIAYANDESPAEALGDDVRAQTIFPTVKAHMERLEDNRLKMVGNGSRGGAPKGNTNACKNKQKQAETTKNNQKQPKTTSYPILSNPKPKKNIYGANNNVLLTDEEFEKLKNKFPDYQTRIDDLSFYLSSKGAKYESHYMTILSWARKENKQTKVVTKNQFTNMTKSDIDFDDLERKLVKN